MQARMDGRLLGYWARRRKGGPLIGRSLLFRRAGGDHFLHAALDIAQGLDDPADAVLCPSLELLLGFGGAVGEEVAEVVLTAVARQETNLALRASRRAVSSSRAAPSNRRSSARTASVSAFRLRRAYSRRNQRPRSVSMTAASMASKSASLNVTRVS